MEVHVTPAKPRKWDYRVRVTNGYKMVQTYVKGGQAMVDDAIAELKRSPWLVKEESTPTPQQRCPRCRGNHDRNSAPPILT